MIKLKRAYDEPSDQDGYRVLVDRLWPRGVSKQKLHADEWLKEAGPSAELRQWFGHDPAKWVEFKERYWSELKDSPVFAQLAELAREQTSLTLLFGSADTEHNQAVALREFLERR